MIWLVSIPFVSGCREKRAINEIVKKVNFVNFTTLPCTDLVFGTSHKGIGSNNSRKFCDRASSHSLCVGLSRKEGDTSNR